MDKVELVARETMRSLKAYLRAQFMIMGVVFLLYSIGLFIIGMKLPVLKALGIAIVDVIPILGSGIVMIPWAIYYLAIGQKSIAMSLGILFVIIAVLRMIIEPLITGKQIGLHPLIAIAATFIGSLFLGPVGVILGPIIAVILTTILRVQSMQTVQSNERVERKKKRQMKREE